ncbi:MAG: HEAT repeat domain-containing protein, partial [Pirellulaceae bacterium]|nr:HEAT repeat domain-containing protein [Pirellulaceae bacterium]
MGARSSWSSLLAIGLLGLAASCEAADPVAPRPDDPDLLLWLDAEDRHSLDTDEHGLVSQWRSKATRTGGHVTAADERRPTWIADAWQGRPAVRFDGRDDVLRNEQFRQVARHWTLAIVVAPHSNSGSGVLAGYHGFFSTNAHGRQDFVTGLNVDMGGRESDRLIGVNVEGSRGGGETNLLLTGSDFGQPRVLVVWAGPDQTTLFAESARQASRPASGAVTSLEEIRVGARRYLSQGESGFVAADIAEVILYARALSNAELDELSRYLEAKHGVVRATATERRLSLDEALAALPAIQWDRSRLCLATIDDQLRGGDATARRSLEQRLAALLGKEDISDAAADAICRRLEIIGTAESVAALSHLLNNPLRSGAALRALQQIPGPEAGQVLVTALANAEPAERVALIQTLGARREQQAVEILLDALRQPDAAVAAAAAAALGSLGAPRSVPALLHSPAATPHDLLALARQLATTHGADAKRVYEHLAQHADEAVRVAAFRGLVMLEPAAARERLWEALAGDQPRLRGMAAQLLAQDCPEPLAA